MSLESGLVRDPSALRGVPPRYQVFDRRVNPPRTVSVFYFDPGLDCVVFEVYDDDFREFLKRAALFPERRFGWMLDVAPDAPADPREALVHPDPMPATVMHGAEESVPLTLDEAVSACREADFYVVIRTSDPR